MTTNKLTDELVEVSELQMLIDSHEKGTAMFMRVNSYYLMAKELQERRKADSAEPVAYWRYAFRADGFCYADGINSKKHHDAHPLSQLSDGDYWRVTPLYSAPPAPVVPEEIEPDSDNTYDYVDGWNACRAAMLQAGNSPVTRDGYVLVPVVPTEDMIINGFESVPDPHFSDEKEWEEYKSLSGCRQAARRAELCWAAMIKAAPKQEVNRG